MKMRELTEMELRVAKALEGVMRENFGKHVNTWGGGHAASTGPRRPYDAEFAKRPKQEREDHLRANLRSDNGMALKQ